MANITGRRMMAEIDGDFVVFLIGARFNSFHLLKTVLDLGGRRGMKHMLDYLVAHPEKGLLGYQMGLPTIVQYWRSFDHLEAFANDTGDPHVAAWRNYWRRVGTSTRTGIWHETYLVRAGEYEAIYGNTPPFGLGKAGRLIPLTEGKTARQRFRAAAGGPADCRLKRAQAERADSMLVHHKRARVPSSPSPWRDENHGGVTSWWSGPLQSHIAVVRRSGPPVLLCSEWQMRQTL